MTARLRKSLALLCATLALALCAALVLFHWQSGAFATQVSFAVKPVRRAAAANSLWPRGTVDVNTADLQALCTLTGVGPSLAAAIIAEREANGAFFYPEDLLSVNGIGAKTLAKFINQLDFSAQAAAQP